MLAIAGGKGGCGKTTTTLGLAADLARRGRRTLAVDADRDMPDLHALAGVPNEPTVAALAGGAGPGPGSDRPPLARVARAVPDHPRAAVVPAAPGVGRDDLRAALRRLRHAPGRTLVDCPAGAGPAAVDPVRVADRVLVVTTATPPSLRDAAKTAALARAVGTPVAAAVVARTGAVPEGVERLLAAPAVAVPEADDPLSDPDARAARREVLRTLA
jgi:septum site-determining protein MinD